ncbi:hypothetical protein I317_04330 [Kwoniella heveanensis CBS 569]|nr:hypothetical protein I317_04330 [Kwoniella heveanensis CBS 569]
MTAYHPYQTTDHALDSASSVSPQASGSESTNTPLLNSSVGLGGEGGVGKWTGSKAAPVKAACLSCRTKKAKCDGKQPVCGQCAKKNLECVFVKSRRGGARKRRQVLAPTALSDFLKKLDDLIAAPAMEHDNFTPPPADPAGIQEDTTNIVKQFATREEVFERYYDDVHPYATVMPPRNYLETILPTLLPASPFLLAVQTLLVLVPHPNDPNPNSSHSKRQRQIASRSLNQQTLQLIDSMVDNGNANLECVQALAILALWEWSNSGSVAKNRTRAGQAIQIAMELGLHEIDKYSQGGTNLEGADWQGDMARRTWWTTYIGNLTASIVSGSTPVVGPDDPRIKVNYPVCSINDKSWPNFIETVKQCVRIFTLVNTVYFPQLADSPAWGAKPPNTPEYKSDMRQQIYDVDKQIMDLMKQAEVTSVIELVPGGEEEVVRNQQLQARLGLAVLHIHIHRFQAFPEVSLFSKRICGLPQAPDFSNSSPATGTPTTSVDDPSVHPFTSPASSANTSHTSSHSNPQVDGIQPTYDMFQHNNTGALTFDPNSFSGVGSGTGANADGAQLHQYNGVGKNGFSEGLSNNVNGYQQLDWAYDNSEVPADQQAQMLDYVMDDLWAPEMYPENLPAPWFSYPGGAAALYAPVMQEPTHYPEVTASIAPITTPPSASTAASADGSGNRRASHGSSTASTNKPHKAWGVDDKADKVLPPPDSQMMDVFPPGISLARCATAAHTIVRLEVLHRSAVMAMWDGPPKWPPFCSCGLVTGAYAFLLLALAVQAENTFTGYTNSRSEEVEALLTNVKVILAGLEAYGTMWEGIDAMAGEVRAALEAATRLPMEVQAQIKAGTPEES